MMKPVKQLANLDVGLAQQRMQSDRNESGLGENLRELLLEAQEQDRLTCGIYESAKLLELRADNIMLCILPENSSSDVTLYIHFKLIEAFCWENEIRILRVDSAEKLRTLLTCEEQDEEDKASDDTAHSGTDYNCILIEYPLGKCSPAEEKLIDFHNVTYDMFPQPVIPLNV